MCYVIGFVALIIMVVLIVVGVEFMSVSFYCVKFRQRFIFIFFFFFQAEDGIRDHCVTGVQTCALPICLYRATGLPHNE